MKYGKISLVLGFLLVLSMFSFLAFVPTASAYTITVDGNPNDWLADASAQPVNTGKWYYNVAANPYSSEYVWKDEGGDDTGDGDYTYPTNWNNTACADILEFRVTWDANNLYLLFKMADVTNEWNDPLGFCQVYLQVLIDNDFAHKDRQEFADAEATWYTNPEITPDWQLRIKGNNTGPFAWWGGSIAVYPWTPYPITARGDASLDCIEVSCPLSLIGNPSGKDWKFAVGATLVGEQGRPSSVGGGANDPMEVNETAGYMCGGGGGLATDPNCWADPDLYDLCFYSSKTAQEGDLSDYDCSATSYPNWYDRCALLSYPVAQYSGEGWRDLAFRNQMGEIFIMPGKHSGELTPPVHTPCTQELINASAMGLDIGDTFTAQIYINNVTNLWTWGLDLAWDPRCLDLLSWAENWTWYGDPPPTPGQGYTATINHTKGAAEGAGWTLTTNPVSGSGPIVDLVFQIKNYTGAFGIPLITTISWSVPPPYVSPLGDYDGNDIYLKEHYGLFTNPPPPPRGPTAIIGQSAPPYYVCENISLWSASTPGWNGFAPVAINNCTWTIINSTVHYQDVTNGTHVFTTPVTIDCQKYSGCPIWFHPLVEDTYIIILEVRTKSDAVLDSLRLNYDDATTTKTAKKKALIYIECFTNKMRRCGYNASVYGWGENLPADAYMLDELVTLYAWVVYRNNPMQNRLVSFEVYSPLGLFLVEQNMTNANGVAFIKFRIPTLCVDPESLFGKWWCFQKVMLCDNYYNDTVYWDVGWIVHLLDVTIVNANGVPVTDIDMDEPFGVKFWLKNIAMAPRDVLIAIKILDDNLVPVVFLNFTTTYDEGDYCKPYYNVTTIMGLKFPKWIYPGTCTVIVDAWFHTLPSGCGHCCCPPVKATFLVTQQEPPPPDP